MVTGSQLRIAVIVASMASTLLGIARPLYASCAAPDHEVVWISPQHGAVGVDPSTRITWISQEWGNGGAEYWSATLNGDVVPVEGSGDLYSIDAALEPSTSYTLELVVSFRWGAEPVSSTFSFSTAEAAVAAPSLTAPIISGAQVQPLDFIWNSEWIDGLGPECAAYLRGTDCYDTGGNSAITLDAVWPTDALPENSLLLARVEYMGNVSGEWVIRTRDFLLPEYCAPLVILPYQNDATNPEDTCVSIAYRLPSGEVSEWSDRLCGDEVAPAPGTDDARKDERSSCTAGGTAAGMWALLIPLLAGRRRRNLFLQGRRTNVLTTRILAFSLTGAALLCVTLTACSDAPADNIDGFDTGLDTQRPYCETVSWSGPSLLPVPTPRDVVDPRATNGVLYELQVRTANACDPDVGSEAQRAACVARPAPVVSYRAEGTSCATVEELEKIRLGTIDDLMGSSTDYREAITLRYIAERVGANLLWVMPLFPNNDIIAIPDACDNLGSPYAVRDYFHAAGTLSRRCIAEGRDEYSAAPCWANNELDAMIEQADSLGLTVMLDVAFNHFGHQYLSYDVAGYTLPDSLSVAELNNFDATFDEALVWPEVLDSIEALEARAADDTTTDALLMSLRARCTGLAGDALVRAFHAWRLAFVEERATFACDDDRLEARVPSFYLGADGRSPSSGPGDSFTRDWRDVRFLFHRLDDPRYERHALRTREYVFRAMNYWMSRGVGGFRLDHATDDDSGIRGPHWDYIRAKLTYYAALRGQAPPVLLAEEFHHQDEMVAAADIMTEGYLFDMNGRNGVVKDAPYVERALARADRFGFGALVMAALENHDELRLVESTGFGFETGAGFWSLGAASATTPMLLIGQEFGQPTRLNFKRSHFLSARFEGGDGYRGDNTLLDWYASRIGLRRSDAGAPLRGLGRRFLRTPEGGMNDGVVAMLRWSDDGSVVLAIHNLWASDRTVRLTIPPDLAGGVFSDPCHEYQLVDLLDGTVLSACRSATEQARLLSIYLPAGLRHRWVRFERCE